MKSQVLAKYNNIESMRSEPWPLDATLYQPYEAEQIILPESASCLAVKTYLKMCDLPYNVLTRANAEFMSPGGRMTKLPILVAGKFVLAEFEPIVNYVEVNCDRPIGKWLDEDKRDEMRTYVSMTENIFTMAELYVSFVIDRVYEDITAPRNGVVFPWPLNKIQNFCKRRQTQKILQVYQWDNMSIEDVIEKVGKCCENLQMKYQDTEGPFFYGEEPCELDAIVFGHLFSIVTTKLPNMDLAKTVKEFGLLMQFCNFIDDKYFQTKLM